VSDGEDDVRRSPATGSGEPAWQRKKRLDAVFGDVLPETTSDERDADAPADEAGDEAADRWLRAQVPPHHG
jgi:hypothetical protein